MKLSNFRHLISICFGFCAFALIPGVLVLAGNSCVRLFVCLRRNQTSLSPLRAGWDSTPLVVLARRVRSTRPRARLPASGQTRKPEDWLAPSPHATGSATAAFRPTRRSFPSAKFRCSAEFIGATDAPLKFSAALRTSSPHPSRQDFDF